MAGPEPQETDFDGWAWHDCTIYGLELRVAEPERNDWTSDLVFHIDCIVEWLCAADSQQPAQFRVAPALLAFHGVTDPRIQLEWGLSGYRSAITEIAIDHIERRPARPTDGEPAHPLYYWRIVLNWPADSVIEFGADAFSQFLLAGPILTDAQQLTPSQRKKALGLMP